MSQSEQKTLQVQVVKRFMTDEEWTKFQKEYWSNRYAQQSRNRAQSLSLDITSEEIEVLKAYTQETDVSMKELKERFPGKNPGYSAGRVAVKILHQHPEFLQRL